MKYIFLQKLFVSFSYKLFVLFRLFVYMSYSKSFHRSLLSMCKKKKTKEKTTTIKLTIDSCVELEPARLESAHPVRHRERLQSRNSFDPFVEAEANKRCSPEVVRRLPLQYLVCPYRSCNLDPSKNFRNYYRLGIFH